MSEILVKVDGGWTDDPVALAASLSAMANKDELQTKLIAALEAEIARLRESLAIFVHADATGNSVPPHIEEQAKRLLPPGPEPKEPNRE